jgi:hypothetical protein
LDSAKFDRDNRVLDGEIRVYIKEVLNIVTHIIPGKDWKDRLGGGDDE